MTREEAIKRLEWLRMVGNHVDSVTLDKEDMPYFDMAIAALKEQNCCKKCNSWVSVEERLPEKNGRYLIHETVFNKWKGYMSVCSFSPCYEGVEEHLNGKCLWYSYDSEYGDYEKMGVTHWMPLPEPPKEE